jgi:hypothetical protein
MTSVSFQNLHTLPINERVVRDDTGYKAANSGSLGSRLVNWLKETFFPGIVRQENIAAYEGARRDWAAQNGSETEEVADFFDQRIAAGERFTVRDTAAVRQLAGTEMGATVTDDIAGLVEPRKPATMFQDTGLAEGFVLDYPRATYTLNGELLASNGVEADGTPASSDHPEQWVGRLEAAISTGIAPELVVAVTNSANQNALAGVFRLISGEDTPLIGPGGERIPLMALPPHRTRFDIIAEGPDAVRVCARLTIEQTEGSVSGAAPFDQIAPGSSADFYFEYVVEKDGRGGARLGEVGPLVFNSNITGVVPAVR